MMDFVIYPMCRIRYVCTCVLLHNIHTQSTPKQVCKIDLSLKNVVRKKIFLCCLIADNYQTIREDVLAVVTHATDSSLRKVSDMTSNFSPNERTNQRMNEAAAVDPATETSFLSLSFGCQPKRFHFPSAAVCCLPHTHTFRIDDASSPHFITHFLR